MDVAISGSTPAAAQGDLTLLAGGNAELFQAAQPIFDAIARQYFHLGPSGAGITMKAGRQYAPRRRHAGDR